ncbi:MAG: hypothetical protein PHH30_08390, partial [Bacteroidales bacterium]|nr:hypothetical protein [Bacteroidales bacterium]
MKKYLLLIIGIVLNYGLFAIDAPGITAPSNGSTNQPITLTLDWTSITGNEGYLYQLDTIPSFDSPLLLEGETSTNTSQIGVSNLYFGKTYYWRAATKSGVEVSDWSATWSFTTASTISNLSPSNSATNQPVTVELDWNSMTGNTGYVYQFDTLPSFDSPLLIEAATVTNSSGVYVNDLYFGTTYYWRAAVKNAVDTSGWSPTWSFTTASTISNISPSNSATNQPVTL